MKSIKAVVDRVVNPIAKKRGIIHGKIILEWEKIVGSQYAAFCAPLKITFRQGYRTYGVLHIKVNPGHALLLTHSKDLIVEKVNTFFGYPAISTLKMMQVPFTHTSSSRTLNVIKNPILRERIPPNCSPQERLNKALDDLKFLIEKEEKLKKAARFF
ncbi:MAG: DUF721 domain-containing protein [Alphaproteobacteria bacterium]|nr:DUF721 domain-containing protein [Alphaproteobacteria bacterium]NCQ66272.1 DUF721 domain-containing protein [Alphaproteobacteria bacterium]NCT06620.1 DUF721 domain-containing protein [Alphaproteobacteria bacterium]